MRSSSQQGRRARPSNRKKEAVMSISLSNGTLERTSRAWRERLALLLVCCVGIFALSAAVMLLWPSPPPSHAFDAMPLLAAFPAGSVQAVELALPFVDPA